MKALYFFCRAGLNLVVARMQGSSFFDEKTMPLITFHRDPEDL
jgi:hypothetical protein